MDFKNLVVSEEDRIGIITINRLERYNALDLQTEKEIGAAFDVLDHDGDTARRRIERTDLTVRGERRAADKRGPGMRLAAIETIDVLGHPLVGHVDRPTERVGVRRPLDRYLLASWGARTLRRGCRNGDDGDRSQ